MTPRVGAKSRSGAGGGSPERLSLRWALIVIVAAAAAAGAFTVGGPLAALGTACLVVSTLHRVLA
jgi:hypothetical protein